MGCPSATPEKQAGPAKPGPAVGTHRAVRPGRREDSIIKDLEGRKTPKHTMTDKKTDADWRAKLTPEQYHVLREKGTERAFTGAYVDNHADGMYRCAACGEPLFDSATKYDSGSGWPSFFKPLTPGAVATEEDSTHGMRRVEIKCAKCGSHLGHVFPDGPRPTGERYCVNSLSLDFQPKAEPK
jgi:peptide-methionine (R)-S-oxide reductase